MPLLQLPHTKGCLVCGRENPHGLHLPLFVDPDTASVQTTFTPAEHHIGFQGIVHGGIIATVVDEAMVWSAIWETHGAAVAGELTVRYRRKALVGEPILVVSELSRRKGKLIETTSTCRGPDGQLIATASGKYLALSESDTAGFIQTFVTRESSAEAMKLIRTHFALGFTAK